MVNFFQVLFLCLVFLLPKNSVLARWKLFRVFSKKWCCISKKYFVNCGGRGGGMENWNKYKWLGKIIRRWTAKISILNLCQRVLNIQLLYYFAITLLKKHPNVLKCKWKIRLYTEKNVYQDDGPFKFWKECITLMNQ